MLRSALTLLGTIGCLALAVSPAMAAKAAAKAQPPKAATSKTEAPKPESPKGESPKDDTAKGGDPKPSLVGEFSDWAAYAYKTPTGQVCYIVSQPKKSNPDNAKRDPIFFLVTHRPGDNVRNEVNTIIGYAFKKESTATLTIDGDDFNLFTKGDGAWSDSKDSTIVTAMRKGKTMEVKGTSWRGTSTVDSYSLSGVKQAMDKIDQRCK